MRVLHINIADDGLATYGLLYGEALSQNSNIDDMSLFNQSVSDTPFMANSLKRCHHQLLKRSSKLDKFFNIRTITGIIKEFKPDIVHDTCGTGSPSGLLLWPFISSMAPLVITAHDPAPHSGQGKSMIHRLSRKFLEKYSAMIIVHGSKCKEMLLDRNIPGDQISIAPHGHLGYWDRGAHNNIIRDPNTILFFGGLRPNKGVELLLPIADKVHELYKDAKFVVAGETVLTEGLGSTGWGEKVDDIINQMRQRPFFEVHHGHIPNNDVEMYFKRAQITLLPYLDATQSGIAPVAMPLGSTVISTNVGDIPEMIEDQQTGILCDVDVNQIVEAIVDLLSDNDKSRRLAQNAKDYAFKELSWGSVVKTSIDIYKNTIDSSARQLGK